MEIIDTILAERPSFHKPETEIQRDFNPQESLLPNIEAQKLILSGSVCYGIGADVVYFIKDSVGPNSLTLEIGSGISTLVFAITGARHIAITPDSDEVVEIKKYAKRKHIQMDKVSFAVETSESYLPRLKTSSFDLVLLDGKHAFPWPVIDWFYTAGHLKKDGLMLLDDTNIKAVSVLVDYMNTDPGWTVEKTFGKTVAYRKLREDVFDVAWHMQPYNFINGSNFQQHKSLLGRLFSKIWC